MWNSSIAENVFIPSSELRRASRAAVWSALWDHVTSTVSSIAKAYAEHRRAQRAITELSDLSDRMLNDIGIARRDIPRIVHYGNGIGELTR
jgi:uncharacterized protein YjiS (DUF1127 family)